MSKFFINRPIVAMVISIVLVIVGAITILSLPVAQFPNIAPPEIQDHCHLHRGGRANPRAIGRHSHRAADERRGQHELHVFAERHRQLDHQLDRGLRPKNRSEHGLHPGAKPGDARCFPTSRGRHELRSHRSKVSDCPAHVNRGVLAAWNLRRQVFGQLCVHQSCGSHPAFAGNRQRSGIRLRPIRDAIVGKARPAGKAGHHRSGNRQRHSSAEHRQPSREGGRRTGTQGHRNLPIRFSRKAA